MMEAVQYHPLLHSKESNAPFIGKPTTKLEQEWDKLWQCMFASSRLFYFFSLISHNEFSAVGSLGIPDEKLPLLNKSTTEYPWHHVPSELGGGVEAFFEGFHYLHCLVSCPCSKIKPRACYQCLLKLTDLDRTLFASICIDTTTITATFTRFQTLKSPSWTMWNIVWRC